jgi:methionine-rich copper-binding protein CopC
MFHYTATTSNTSTVTIYNTSGARMLTTRVKIQTGTNALSINLDGRFTSGTYLLEVINGTERTVSKLIKK